MEIADMRGYSDKRVIGAVLQRRIKKFPNSCVKFRETNNKLYITTFNGGSRVEITVPENDREWLIRSCAEDKLYIAGVVSFDHEAQTVKVIVLRYNEEKSMDLKCGADDNFLKQLRKSVMLPNPKNMYDSLYKLAAAALSSTQSVFVLGVKTAAAEDEYPDFLIACDENSGYIALEEREGVGTVCSGIVSNIPDVDDTYRFYIVYGKLEFLPEEELGEKDQQSLIENVKEDISSGLSLWGKVGEYEITSALSNFTIGSVRCSFSPSNEKKICFETDQIGKASQFFDKIKAAPGTALLIWNDDPSEIIEGVRKVIENGSVKNLSEIDEQLDATTRNKTVGMRAKATVKLKNTTVVISDKFSNEGFRASGILPIEKPERRFEGECCLTYNPSGNYVMFKRRAVAKEKIVSLKNPMPCLKAILDGHYSGHPKPESRTKIPVMDESSGSDFFAAHRLNPTQYEAVQIALNTPDIAAIQGPPGTGKTTVIAAIVHRLNELSGDRENIFGQNLVSAFQHVAVDNALDRMDIFGIPVIKIGEKNERYGDRKVINVNIENWMLQQQKQVLEKNPSVNRFSCDKRFIKAYKAYLCSSNSIEAAVMALSEAYDLLRDLGKLSSDAGREVCALLEKLSSIHSGFSADGNDLLISVLSRLPVNYEAYSDGGKRVIDEAIALLNTHNEPIKNYSEKLEAFLAQPDDQKNFSEMRSLRARIISEIKPKPDIFTTAHENSLVQGALTHVSELIHKFRADINNPEEFALGDYFDSLCYDYGFVKDTIISYSAICGATNQHSSSAKMTELKEDEFFDNVIIDEAARSNPLDLIIPMSLAKERIILVGDHRQLPHLIDKKLAEQVEREVREIKGDEDLDIKKKLENSLFEQLKNMLTEVEKHDHIKRCITLDKQYRTHPLLGEFVSRVFYERHDKSEAFESPRPASDFSHSLPGLENKAAVWMDVPASAGMEEESGNSYIRGCEARAIVKHIKKMMDSDAGKNLTFGIITFYSAQVEEIQNAMRDEGMADRNSKEFLLKDEYARGQIHTKNGKETKIVERLRIGSVDSFQGMEFDVVYLSVVRCNRENRFGFLKMENRLCVAMSRQERLLIAAGDRKMFETDAARNDVSQICEFLKLCESEDKYCAVI